MNFYLYEYARYRSYTLYIIYSSYTYMSLRMTGDERTNAAKALLLRIVPAGLITYLKHTPLDEGQKEVLDDIEYEYYAQYLNNASVLLSRPHVGATSLHSQVSIPPFALIYTAILSFIHIYNI